MPGYPFLAKTPLEYDDIAVHLETNRMVGVPYDDVMIKNARIDLEAQVDPDSDGAEAVLQRYPKAQIRDFDGDAKILSEMDALIAYLQMLGTLVDFDVYKADGDNLR